MSSETIEQIFEVQSPAHLKVSNIRGHVDVRPGEDNNIKVKAVKHNHTGSGKSSFAKKVMEASLPRQNMKIQLSICLA